MVILIVHPRFVQLFPLYGLIKYYLSVSMVTWGADLFRRFNLASELLKILVLIP